MSGYDPIDYLKPEEEEILMSEFTGVIDAVRRDGKGFKIGDDWFSAYKASMLAGAKVGDEVTFEYKVNGNFKNVVGQVNVVSAGAGGGASAQAASTAGSTAPASKYKFYDRNLGYLVKTFPVEPLHPDRSIIRQNALTHATALVLSQGLLQGIDLDAVADHVIQLARSFEAYSAGDIDRMEAEAAMAEAEA